MAEETIVAICQFGGGFVSDGGRTMSYTGGEAHALDISRGMKLHDFKSEISDMFKIDCNTISINCFDSKQSLIKISSDKDLEQMVDSNIDPGTIDIYISIEADTRTRVADSGTSIAEAAANVETPDSRKTSKRKTRTSVSPSVKPVEPGGRGRGRGNTGKTTKRVTRPSVSPVKAMKSGGGGAAAGRNTTKRVTRSNVSPSVEAMKPGDGVTAADPGGSTKKTKTKKRKTRSRVSPSVKAMKVEGGGTGSDTVQSTEKLNRRVTRSSVSPSAEAMKPGNGGANADAGQSMAEKLLRAAETSTCRVTRSSVSPSAEAMKPGNGGANADAGQSMAEKLLRAAEKLISAENLAGSKKLALDALEYDPLVEGADQIIAVTDVLLAAQQRINNQVDWYAVLQLDPDTSGREPHTVRQHYRRLTLLLRPGRAPLPATADASRIVADAWAILSDPSKKSLFDAELNIAADPPSGSGPSEPPCPTVATGPTFWTTCSFCFHMHQYFRAYEGSCLQCQNCRHAFLATALTAAPPVVPGTDMYYCSWGFFPLGFSSGIQVGNTSLHAIPPFPSLMNLRNLYGLLPQTERDKDNAMGSEKTALPPTANRRTAVKKTRNNSKKRVFDADPAAVRPEAAAVVADPEAKSGAGAAAARLVTVGPDNSAAVVVEPGANIGVMRPAAAAVVADPEAKSGAARPVTVGPDNSVAVVVEPGANIGAVRPAAVGPENSAATLAEPDAKSGAARPVRPETSAEIVAERSAKSRVVRPVGPKSRTGRPVGEETSAAVVAETEAKSGAAMLAAVGSENSVAVVSDSEAKSGAARSGEARSGAARLVGPENSAVVVAEPKAKSEAARLVSVRPENSAAVVVEPKAESGSARPIAVGPENNAAVVVEPVAFKLEHCDAVVVAEPEAKSEAGRPVAVGPEYCVGVAAKAPVVLDLNEEAGFWEAQDTGLMMDQDQDQDLGSFDFDLDAVDLDAAGDLLGQFN